MAETKKRTADTMAETDTASIGASSKPPFVVPDHFSWDLSLFSVPEHCARTVSNEHTALLPLRCDVCAWQTRPISSR
jgi:hypothetical protein